VVAVDVEGTLNKAMSELAVAADGSDGKYSLKYFDEGWV